MSTTPRSYDEITRSTVPAPDGSYRATPEQKRATEAGELFTTADEGALHDAVSAALTSSGLDASGVTVEVKDAHVTLRGTVRDIQLLPKIEAVVRGVAGVDDIVDHLVVAAK